MTLLAWIALGLFAGFVARIVVLRGVALLLLDCVLLGSLGALLGGGLFGLAGSNPALGLAGAALGAITMLGVCALVRRRGAGVAPVGVAPVGVAPVGVAPVGVAPVGVAPVGVAPVGVAPVAPAGAHGTGPQPQPV
jgi:uncharacterized membrane protein YeaQ/YmgE (transglycosylase-associated protein family)